MDIPTPILAAIIGSIVAGIISFIVNVISLAGQYMLTKHNQDRIREIQWETQSISLTKELRREATRMQLDAEGVEELRPTLEDLQSQRDELPEKYQGTKVENSLQEMEWWYQKYKDESNMLVSELRGKLLENTEVLIDELDLRSDRTWSLY